MNLELMKLYENFLKMQMGPIDYPVLGKIIAKRPPILVFRYQCSRFPQPPNPPFPQALGLTPEPPK